jgi:hypothetical protein
MIVTVVVVVPILVGVPSALLRVVPGVVPVPAMPPFCVQVFSGAASLRAALAVAGNRVTQFDLSLFDVALTSRPVIRLSKWRT